MPEKTLPESLRLRMKQLEEEKRHYESMLYDIARYVNPRRELLRDSQRFDDRGKARGKSSYSGVPNSALSVWVDGMQGHLVSQSLNWFKNITSSPALNRVDEVQAYLQQYDEAMYGEYNRSNYYSVLGEWFRDAGSIGTATLFTEEDIGRGVAVHIPIHPREIFISEDKYGKVDTVFRKFFLTAKQAVDKFGENNLSKDIIDNSKEHPEKKHEFIHAVFPNKDRMFGSLLAIHKPYASVYIQAEANKDGKPDNVIRRSGFDINPYAVWRFRKNSDEIYGYSPAADAMVSIKKIHQMSKTLLEAAHRAVKPVLNIPEHMRGNTRMTPDGHNYYERGGDIIKPVHTGVNYPIAIDREEKVQRIIEDAYRVEFFLILARAEREMTATEIMERAAEKAVLLGPQQDRLYGEGLVPANENVHEIADKAGRLPEPPQILIDANEDAKMRGLPPIRLTLQLIGPLAQARRRQMEMQPIKTGLNEIAQASTIFPKVLDKIDPDKLAERILDSTNFPQDVLRTDEEVRQLREQQEAELAQQQILQQAQGIAEAYPKINEKIEGGSPAELIAGQMGV